MPGIIFEGPDASGKSTLVRKIAENSGREVYLAGGKPRDDPHMWQMIDDQVTALHQGKLVDRASFISQQVYREGLFFREDLMLQLEISLKLGHILVYCRPPTHIMLDPTKHEWKDYDTEEWKATVLANQPDYIERYDRLMSTVPCIIYDWTSEDARHIEELLSASDQEGVLAALRDLVRAPQP